MPDPVVILKRHAVRGKQRVTGYLDSKRCVDFMGYLCATGQCVGIEAKETTQARWKLDTRLRTHQLEFLQRLARAGGIAAVYVRRLPGEDSITGADYLVPVTPTGLVIGNSASFAWSVLAEYHIPPRKTYIDAMCAQPDTTNTADNAQRIHWSTYCVEGWPGLR